MFMSNKVNISDDEIRKMFQEIDVNNDKGISWEEFCKFVKQHSEDCPISDELGGINSGKQVE